MKKIFNIGSDCSGVGAFPQALQRLGLNYQESFACDFDYYARQTYLLNFGTKQDIELSNTKEHKKYSDGVQRLELSNKKLSKDEINFLKEANEFAKKFSFYFPFNMYDREIPKEPIDLYMGSFPCQSFSLAGNRKGEASKKGVLFYCGHEFIFKNKPRYFIIENVKGLLSDDNGKTFKKWIDYLGGKSVNGNPVIFPHENATPYHIYYKIMNAKHYGIPQNRERIFIIGIRDDVDNDFSFPKPIHLTKKLKDVLEIEVDEKYFLSHKMLELIKYNGKTNGIIEDLNKGGERGSVYSEATDAISCLSTTDYKQPKQIQIGTWRTHEDGRGFRATEDNNCLTIPARAREDGSGQPVIKIGVIRGQNSQNSLSTVSESPKNQTLEINENETSNALTTLAKDNGVVIKSKQLSNQQLEKLEKLQVDENIAGCITQAIGRAGSSDEYIASVKRNAIITQIIRRLVPLECFKLMDFNFGIPNVPDFQWNVSDSQAYKTAGNSICVGVLVAIISKLNLN